MKQRQRSCSAFISHVYLGFCLHLGHSKPSKTLFLVLKNQVFGGENLCFSIGLAGAPGSYRLCLKKCPGEQCLLEPSLVGSSAFLCFSSLFVLSFAAFTTPCGKDYSKRYFWKVHESTFSGVPGFSD